MDFEQIDALYTRYGYDIKQSLSNEGVRVYTLPKGVYYGADIVSSKKTEVDASIHKTLSTSGYACRDVKVNSIKELENFLFESFFHSTQLAERLNNKYNRFKKSQSELLRVNYEYIPVSYLLDNEEYRSNKNIIENVCSKLVEDGPQLIILEAAAGFGKTCTSYELVSHISLNRKELAPIFTELSRDRRAAIFKHILQDVIVNEFHSLLDEKLVIHEIQSGRIPLIIDGFDELLSKEQDKGTNEFDQIETMLSTIGQLLKDNAKIVLTGRKTAIFAGDSFQSWIDNNPNEFKVSRYLINPPRITDWLSEDKIKQIEERGIPIKDIANPVLLAFIRSLSDTSFSDVVSSPEKIVEKYFNAILDREQERQELLIQTDEQLIIFENLAISMMELDITSESKEWIKLLIEETNFEMLESTKKLYPTASRPTIDVLTNTLSNHALLDRRGSNEQIGFINDFIFGTFIGQGLLKISDKRAEKISPHMLELASTAYQFQTKPNKEKLYRRINSLKKFEKQEKLIHEYLLKDAISSKYSEASFGDIVLSHISFTDTNQFTDCVFSNCTFESCLFKHAAFKSTSFVNCIFHDCELLDENDSSETSFIAINCDDYNNGFLKKLKTNDEVQSDENSMRNLVLQKYFRHSSNRPRGKKISFLVKDFPPNERAKVIRTIENLHQSGFIMVNGDNSSLTDSGIDYHRTLNPLHEK